MTGKSLIRLTALSVLSLPAIAAAQQPNILLLIADDYGIDQSRLYTESAATPTPNITELAENGVTFDHLWSSHLCSATRATLLSGQYGFRNGVPWVVRTAEFRLGLDEQLDAPHYLPKLVSDQGYETGMIGKWHLSTDDPDGPLQAGFDFFAGTLDSFGNGQGASLDSIAAYWGTYLEYHQCEDGRCEALEFPQPPVAWPVPNEFHSNYRTTWQVDRALEWITERENPWFLWTAFQAPHTPLQLPPEHLVDDELVAAVERRLGAYEAGYWAKVDADIDVAKLVYYSMVSALDTEIGRLLDSIDLSNTWVVFIGDNGTIGQVGERDLLPPGHNKGNHFEGGLNVPFVVAGPDLHNAASRTSVLAHTSDIYATVLAMAGAEVDSAGKPVAATRHAQIDGRSLLPVIMEGAESVYGRRYVLNNSALYPYFNPALSADSPGFPRGPTVEAEVIRDEQYKLHRRTVRNDITGFTCVDGPQPTEANPVPCDFMNRVKAFEFYDLLADPLELNDLLANGESSLNARQREAFSRLRERLSEEMY